MMHLKYPKPKTFINGLLLLVAILLLVSYVHIGTISNRFYYLLHPKDGIKCFRAGGESLPDVSDIKPVKSRSIFFHETSCNSYYEGRITVNARQACAVESAAKLNPDHDIYLLYASPGVLRFEGSESDRMLRELLTYRNVKIMHVDYERYTKGTPVEELYAKGAIDTSGYALSHASDVLRYLTLWKYGGIYLDLDVIVTKALGDLPKNFAGSESDRHVAAGVLGFEGGATGHELSSRCLEDLRSNFDGRSWGANGPGVITRLLKTLCGAEQAKDMVRKECPGFKVYPPSYFYAVPWWNWTLFFDENAADAVAEMTKDSYAVHVWNKHSSKTKLELDSNAPYMTYAKKYCPKVVAQCDQHF